MKCQNCNSEMNEGAQFCVSCGAQQQAPQQQAPQQAQYQQQAPQQPQYQQPQQPYQQQAPAGKGGFMDTKNETASFHPEDIQRNKSMCILCYLGVLLFIPYFAQKDSPYTKFHCNQGLNLALLSLCSYILSQYIFPPISNFIPFIGVIFALISIVISIGTIFFIIVGIINALNGVAKELPIIGKFRIFK